jgi:polar amino acid transport system substrate-binding protein
MIFSTLKITVFAIFYSLCFSILAQTQQINLVGEYVSDMTNNDGTGYQFEMVRAIFEPLGYQVNINVYPYRRALKKVESGQADMMIGMIKEKNMPIIFSNYPHETDKILAIYLDKNDINWYGFSALKNKNLVMLQGMDEDAKERLPIKSHQVTVVNTPDQALKMLMYGRADFIIMTEAEYIINYVRIDNPQANLLSKPIGFIEIHAAFADSTKGNKFKEVWDKHFLTYLKSEKAKSLFYHWGASDNYNTTLNYLTKATH